FLHAVIRRTIRTRIGAFVIDTETAADIDPVDRYAEAAQLGVVARGFAQGALDIANVGELRSEVIVHQLQRLQLIPLAQRRNHRQRLRCGKTEFGFFSARILPFAFADRCQPHAHAETRLHPHFLRFFQHQRELGWLFDNYEDAVTDLFADQGGANIFAVLIAVADDDRPRPSNREYGHEFRFGSRFQAEAVFAAPFQ